MSSAAFQYFTSDAISTSQRELITGPMWSKEVSRLSKMFIDESQSDNNKRYYYRIYDSSSSTIGAEPQFTIAYGHVNGSGSSTGSFGYDPLDYPTKAIYSQYRNLVGIPPGQLFTFANGETSQHIYVINIERSRFKDKLANKTWQLGLMHINATGSALLNQVVVSASNKLITLIDDSTQVATELSSVGGTYYFIRSGSVADGIKVGDETPYGIVYPELGLIILNANALNASASFTTGITAAGYGTEFGGGADNNFKLFTSISGAMSFNSFSGSFKAENLEVIASTYYYARLPNGSFNYSQNPSFYTGSQNELRWPGMYNDPKVYVTTVGLYDDSFNLLGVAKLNKPIAKSFDTEITIKIKLDY